jgi:hypothetical protein
MKKRKAREVYWGGLEYGSRLGLALAWPVGVFLFFLLKRFLFSYFPALF